MESVFAYVEKCEYLCRRYMGSVLIGQGSSIRRGQGGLSQNTVRNPHKGLLDNSN